MEDKAREELKSENEELRDRLREAEDLIQAIRLGKVDALVSYEPEGEKVYTLRSIDRGYRLLVESMNEGAVILSPEGAIYYANPRFEKMIRSDPSRITGSGMIDYVHEEDRPGFELLLGEACRGNAARGEISLKTGDGGLIPVYIALNPLDLEEFNGLCITFTDLTEQKLYIERLEQSNRELQDFVSIASHDLQEPLRKVMTFGDRLKRRYGPALGKDGNGYIDRMLRATARMRSLLNSLLEYSRITSRAEPFSALDLNAVIQEVLSDLEIRLEKTGGDVEVTGLPVIYADATQMHQLFQNLIGNGLKFHKKGEKPVVKISAARTGNGNLRIMVEDNGIGFEEEYLNKIFVPFQRLHGRNEYEGTGMGLAICKKIVERHGGNIEVSSTPGEGTRFMVTLPE